MTAWPTARGMEARTGPRDRRRRATPPAPPPEALEFQSDLDALVAEPAPRLLRMWPALGAALVAGLVGIAAVTRIDVVVTASGRLTPDAPPVVLQPLSGAVLRELRVRPGDPVVAGQVVAVLDSTFTGADRDALAVQRSALAALRDRLTAELDAAPAPAGAGPDAALQRRLHDQRAAFHDARRLALESDLRALDAALAAERAAATGAAEQLAVAEELEAMRLKLAEDQVGSRLNLLVARSARLEAEQRARGHAARIAELGHQAASRTAELEAFQRDWRRQTLEELSRVAPELARVEEQLSKADRLDAMTELRAPAAGVVLEVARRAPGSLVREGEPVVVIVPSDAPLIAEVSLRSADIGWLQPGDAATLKIDAYPWRRFGALDGALRSVSRESYAPQPGEPAPGGALHKGRITLTQTSLARAPDGPGLTPGMTLTAEVTVGQRSVLEFFLEPLLRGLQESLREP